MLLETLEDLRLSRGERRALKEVLEEISPDESAQKNYRHRVFEVARGALFDTRDRKVIDWIEAVVNTMLEVGQAPGARLSRGPSGSRAPGGRP